MTDLAHRFPNNPLLSPADVRPSRPGLRVLGVLNPAVFRFEDKIWLLLRVAEGVPADSDSVSAPVLDPDAPDGMRLVTVSRDDADLVSTDPRFFVWRGERYLTSISHFRLAASDDGVHFVVGPEPALEGWGDSERFGIEDCRVTKIDSRFYLAYTAVSPDGHGISLASTDDWRTYERHGMVLPPPNKDGVLFPGQVSGSYVALHRPVSQGLGGKFIWLAWSPDLRHWGEHQCILRPRPECWDSAWIGAGAPPLRIPEGWLEIYHGVDASRRYCLGAVLLDADDPSKVLGRSRDPIVQPLTNDERHGFFDNVVFADGALANGDELTVYYGAADERVCGAFLSIREILAGLE